MPKGEITHIEFPADDPERATQFYTAVAGWEFGAEPTMPNYYTFRSGADAGGAVGKRGKSTGPVVRIYITVDSLEEACAAAEANGGSVLEQPTDIGGGYGRFAVVRDTEGSEVGLWETSEPAPA